MTTPTWQPPSELAEQLKDLYGLTCPPMWGPPRRLHFPTMGPAVAKVMTQLGFPPMPHQRYSLDVALEVDPVTKVFAYRDVGRSIPRQQGKTQELLGVMVHRLRAWPKQNVRYTAQTRIAALERLEDEFEPTLAAAKLVGKYRFRKKTGSEALIWLKTMSKLGITPNTEKAGHGPPLDLGMMDEAFALEDDRVEQAMRPAMFTRPMGQLWWASAGGTEEKAIWLNKKREFGREVIEELWRLIREQGGISALTQVTPWPTQCYVEFYAPDHLDRNDPATWFTCMPALCPGPSPCTCDPERKWKHTATVATILADRASGMEDAEFDRAYLNRTRRKTPPPDPNVPAAEWPGRVDVESRCGPDLAFAIDVTPSRTHAAIGVYSLREDGMGHVELVDQRRGTDWIVPALLRLRALWNPVAICVDSVGPAASLIAELDKAGIKMPEDPAEPKRGDLIIAGTRDVARGCGQFADAVRQDRLVHIDQAQLNTAMAGARTRPLSDSWAWARRTGTSDISPLVAISLARWAFEERVELVTDYDILQSMW